jgi:hypothetical protein
MAPAVGGQPPFCAAVDWLVAVVLVTEIAVGVGFRR